MLIYLRHDRRPPARLCFAARCTLPDFEIVCYYPPVMRIKFGTGWPVGTATLRGEGASTRDRPARRDLLVQSSGRRSVVHAAATAPRVLPDRSLPTTQPPDQQLAARMLQA